MSKLLSKISIASTAITAVVGGTMYLSSTPDGNKTFSHNSAVAKDHRNAMTVYIANVCHTPNRSTSFPAADQSAASRKSSKRSL